MEFQNFTCGFVVLYGNIPRVYFVSWCDKTPMATGQRLLIAVCNCRLVLEKSNHRQVDFRLRRMQEILLLSLIKFGIDWLIDSCVILRWVIPVVLSRCKCVKKILFVCSHKTQLSAKLSLFLSYNDMFRPIMTAIIRLYMKPLSHMP